jgi:hypothetical protein
VRDESRNDINTEPSTLSGMSATRARVRNVKPDVRAQHIWSGFG